MNAAGFKVTTEKLDEAANYIRDKTDQYNMDIQKLYSEAEGLTTAAWKGIASDAFRQQLEKYHGDFDALRSGLTQFADKLSGKSVTYTKTENNIAGKASAL